MKETKEKKDRHNKPSPRSADDGGLQAAARVIAAGGRVPKKFVQARPAKAGPTAGVIEAMAKIAPARKAALDILISVESGKAHSDELLHSRKTEELSGIDQNLRTALVMGVLRWQIALDSLIQPLLLRPDTKLPLPVAIALRLGVFQLVHMDRVPPYAALSESVEMCRAAGFPHAAGMVNAVLRRISEKKDQARSPIFETVDGLARRLGHPTWLVERWAKQYGYEAARAICDADQQEPLGGGIFPVGEERLPAMDDGSRLVAEIAAAVMPAGGRRVWDCCSAPGGKTLMLSLRLPQAELLATDISARRMAQTQARFRRFTFAGNIRTAVADVVALDDSEGLFDLVLCDVPCSGTGTLARNPEIRLRLTLRDIARHAARQTAILAAALARVAPGGRMVYSTCSLEPEENEAVIAAVAKEWRKVPVGTIDVGFPFDSMVRDGALRTLPGVHPCDGFYAVVLERPSEQAGT